MTPYKILVKMNEDEIFVPYDKDPNYLVYESGKIYSLYRQIFLSQKLSNGYYSVRLGGKLNGKTIRVHRIIARHFVEKEDETKNIVNHKDSDKLNNHYTNLEWVNDQENVAHAINMGNIGGKNQRSPVLKCDPRSGEVLEEFESLADAARQTGISCGMIYHACKGTAKNVVDIRDGQKYLWKRKEELVKLVRPKEAKRFREYSIYALKDGRLWSETKKNFLRLGSNHDGYKLVSLYKSGKKTTFLIHRIIAEVFLDNPNNFSIVHHIDSNRENNNITNLKWVSPEENMIASFDSGGNAKRKRKVYLYNRKSFEFIREFSSVKEASEFSGMRAGHISNILNGVQKYKGEYLWKDKKEKPKYREVEVKLFLAFDHQGKVNRFCSIKSALKFLGSGSETRLGEACKDEKWYHGFHWMISSAVKLEAY